MKLLVVSIILSIAFLAEKKLVAADPAESPAGAATAETSPLNTSAPIYRPPAAAETPKVPARVSGGARTYSSKSPTDGKNRAPDSRGSRPTTASQEIREVPAGAESAVQPAPKLIYKPPAGAGKMPVRVSGGARGENGLNTVLLPLVPDQLALTTQAQPSLFWFQSKPAKAKFELTVIEPKNPAPLISLTSPDADKPGIHRIKLSRYKVELKPDVLYEWTVAIIPDPENRSKDVIAKGVIKRVKAPADLAAQVKKSDDVARASAYAQAGIWYDALDAISNAIEAHPDDASLKEQRASLLKQVGLNQAAALDKKK